jgi:hypothetical protein
MSAASVSRSLMTWAYTRSVIEGSAWPSQAATTCTGTPAKLSPEEAVAEVLSTEH